MSLVIELRQGATLIATRTPTLTSSLATYEFDLTAPERAAITNWAALRLHFIGNTDQSQVSWAEFAVPGAGAVASAAGQGTASGVSAQFLGLQAAVGSAAGTSTGTAGLQFKAAAAGLGTALGVGRAIVGRVGLAVGASAVNGLSTQGVINAAIASASGLATSNVQTLTGQVGIVSATGHSAGSASVEGAALFGNFLTINGIAYNYEVNGFSIKESYKGQPTMTCVIPFESIPPFQPFEKRDEIIVIENGTRIFGGIIDNIQLRGVGNEGGPGVEYVIYGAGYATYADKRFVINGGFPEGTLMRSAFTSLCGYLVPYGITVSPSIAPGPALPLIQYDIRSIRNAFDELSDITEYIWGIDYYKQATMLLPGAIQAPFNVVAPFADIIGDVVVEPAKIDYANELIVQFGSGNREVTWNEVGDGITSSWVLPYKGIVSHNGYLETSSTPGGPAVLPEPVAIGPNPAAYWNFDVATNTMNRVIGPTPANFPIKFTFTTQYPQTIIETNYVEQEFHPVSQAILKLPDVFVEATARTIAQSWLPRYVAQPRSCYYITRRGGVHPGMLQYINSPIRGIDATCFVSDVTINATEVGFVRRVSLLEGALLQGSWRDLYRMWGRGTGTGSGGSTTTIPGGGGTTTINGRSVYFLGGSGLEAVQSNPVAWLPASAIQVRINTATRGSTTGVVTVRLKTAVLGANVTARLQNLEDNVTVGISTAVSGPNWQTVTFPVTLTVGEKTYELQLLPSVPDSDVAAVGYFE